MKNTLLFTFIGMTTIISAKANAIEILKFCQGNMPPYSFPSTDSEEAEGIWPTVLRTVFKENINIQINAVILPWKRCQMEVLHGQSDGFFMATYTEAQRIITCCQASIRCAFPTTTPVIIILRD